MPVRAVFVYANPRAGLTEAIQRGEAPDTGLLGQNHLAALGIESRVHDPALGDRRALPARLRWSLREVTLAWELGDADVACSAQALLFPLAARLRRRPRVLVLNLGLCTRFQRSSAAQRRLIRTALGSAAGVVCFAAQQRRRLLDQTGLAAGRVHVVHFGVDDSFYRPEPLAPEGYVLAAGRDLARDYATFARAVKGLDARAKVVASRRNLEGVRLPANAEARVDVGYPQLRELYRGAACIVVPTRAETFPYGADCSGHTVLLEAMAMARPAVLSHRSTNADYVRNGETALEVPPEDPAALREGIERILADRALAKRLAADGRASVEEQFTTRHLAARLARLIEAAA